MTDANRNWNPENDTIVRINNPQTANNFGDIYLFSFIRNANFLLFIFAIYQNAINLEEKSQINKFFFFSEDFCQLFRNLSQNHYY